MEFKYRSGDQKDFSSSSSSFSPTSYFSEQAVRAGIVPSTMSRTEALVEELRKERIREEMLAKEIACKRMLEEELLRELELERRLETKSSQNEGFSPLKMESRLRERSEPSFKLERRFETKSSQNEEFSPLEMESRLRERSEPSFMGKYLEIRDKRRSPSYPDIKMDGSERSVGAFEKPLAARRAIVEKLGLDKFPWKSETSGSKDNKLLDQKASGIKRKAAIELPQLAQKKRKAAIELPQLAQKKRKAAIELPQLAQKEWSCSLCRVTATSQKNLNVHLHGKKHKVKEAQLTNNKAASNNSNTSSSFKNDSNVPLDQEKDMEGKKQEYKKQQPRTVCCDMCKVKCNSLAMMDCHLNGNKHKAQMESRKGAGAGNGTTSATEVVKEVTDQYKKQQPRTVCCDLCKVKCNSLAMMDCHLNGKKHKAQMESRKGAGAGNGTTSATEVVKEVTDQKEKQEQQEEVKPEEDAKLNSEEASNKTLFSSWERYVRSEELGEST